jgi:hypothetical protein
LPLELRSSPQSASGQPCPEPTSLSDH